MNLKEKKINNGIKRLKALGPASWPKVKDQRLGGGKSAPQGRKKEGIRVGSQKSTIKSPVVNEKKINPRAGK